MTQTTDKGTSLIIKGLSPGLPERGKIKIGYKGKTITSAKGNDFQPPKKLEHFLITTLERDKDGNFKRDTAIHKIIGEKPKEIPVKLIFNDLSLNFQCRYVCYHGRSLFCSGDGEFALRREEKDKPKVKIECPCERIDPEYGNDDVCKPNGVLSVLIDIDKTVIGGVWKFRTTSYNSIRGILSSLQLISHITGGQLSGIPLKLKISPKATTIPGTDKTTTVHVVGLEFDGDVNLLQKTAYDRLLNDNSYLQRVGLIEAQTRRVINVESIEGDEDSVDEFYPDQAEKEPPDLDLSDDSGNGKQKIENTEVEEVDEKPETKDEQEAPTEQESEKTEQTSDADQQDEDTADNDAPNLDDSDTETEVEPAPAGNGNGAKNRLF